MSDLNVEDPTRASQLSPAQMRLLRDWADRLSELFKGDVAYLVGSVLTDPDYRDVDVRLILEDETFDNLADLIDLPRLGAVLSMWGWGQTERMNIDFQIQRMTEANTEYEGRRNALI